jgi:hypothetical protein
LHLDARGEISQLSSVVSRKIIQQYLKVCDTPSA